ncbi:hypothetical protein SMD22_01675 (plasmid) [Brevibacillus halotolerans]|nr:hypothetical protein SMD22_01675 [Brevibacillus halotolerans]
MEPKDKLLWEMILLIGFFFFIFISYCLGSSIYVSHWLKKQYGSNEFIDVVRDIEKQSNEQYPKKVSFNKI